jgi:hypothetical protein
MTSIGPTIAVHDRRQQHPLAPSASDPLDQSQGGCAALGTDSLPKKPHSLGWRPNREPAPLPSLVIRRLKLLTACGCLWSFIWAA